MSSQDTPLVRASKAVAVGCKSQNGTIQVKLEPFEIHPDDLFLRTYVSMGILDESALRAVLVEILPRSVSAAIQQMPIDLSDKISITVMRVEDILITQVAKEQAEAASTKGAKKPGGSKKPRGAKKPN